MKAVDDTLGRSFTFYDRQPGWVVQHHLQVTRYDPARGWRLAGTSFASAWVPFDMWERLLEEGVLVPR